VNMKNTEIKIFLAKNWADYEILDTGEGEKLERVGKYKFVRPYEDAVWKKTLPASEWNKVDGKFWSSKEGAKSGWKMNSKIEPKWQMSYKDIKFWSLPTPFRHYGFFPEQASQWNFIENKIKEAFPKEIPLGRPAVKVLNLFGYTGLASLAALSTGAEVTHVDASKTSIAWAKENQELSNMSKLPMRIITDDVMKFLEREEKRGNKYDAVIMDPPKFGRGPKGETWKLEKDLPKLLERVVKVLSDKPLFVILTSYATDSSALSLGFALEETMKNFKGEIEQGELCLFEKSNSRTISLARTAIWQAD
jgi:23S rRNA (cytosine1962-C5)-methyltransferase